MEKSNLVNWLVLLALTACFIYGISSCREYQKRPQAIVGTNSAEVVQVVKAEPPVSVAQESDDGSVIVRDKGASFKMMPASNKQPAVVTEQEVRNRTNRMPQQ